MDSRSASGLEPPETKAFERDQDGGPKEKTLLQRFRVLLSLMTIEPMMVMQGIASSIVTYPTDQMILYKICRETESDEFCANIEEYTNTTNYDMVEEKVVNFNNVITLSEHLVPILLSFYIGSWSDHYGRIPFLAFCMSGKVAGAVFNLLNAIYLSKETG